MNELQASIEPTFAVLPESSVLLQPCKTAFDHPSFWDYRKGVQLTALGDLHRDVLTQNLLHTPGKGLARIAAVGQHALHVAQSVPATTHRLQGSFPISHFGSRNDDGMRESLRIHSNMALDA